MKEVIKVNSSNKENYELEATFSEVKQLFPEFVR